ncbi:hypothetical protein [Bradyrhizobium iriomotense]|uniref:hypothetical protein n=1 Tax=Bradyrhizobium iriomotense TaxID=441950 RepID=UPI0024E082A7|nr:hypothetical protein [Bradyrhizobium iriomotense]
MNFGNENIFMLNGAIARRSAPEAAAFRESKTAIRLGSDGTIEATLISPRAQDGCAKAGLR